MLFLALKHLFSRPRQTLITLIGVMLGTGAYVAFSGLMSGFQEYIIDQLVNNDSHVRISAKDVLLNEKELTESLFPEGTKVFWLTPPSGTRENPKITNPIGWFEQLKADHRVLAFSPQIQTQALFSKGPTSVSGKLIGVDPIKQRGVTNIENYMQQGEFIDIARGGNQVLLGDGLFKKLGLRMNDTIHINSSNSSPIPFKVVGTFHIGIPTIDDALAYGLISDVQTATLRHSQITDIVIRLTDVEQAKDFANSYSLFTQDKVQSWDQANSNILSVFTLQNLIRNFVTVSILVVAAFGIYNILNILVNQKRKDIGILRSIGYDSNDILQLFLTQGLILGFLGGTLGLSLGFLLAFVLSQVQGPFSDKMLVSFSPSIYLSGFLLAIVASTISSFLPAKAAGKLNPIDVIRSGE